MELKNQFSAAYDAGKSVVQKEATDHAWPWETTIFVVFAVVGSDAFRALLAHYTSLSSIFRHGLSIVFVVVIAEACVLIRKSFRRAN
jgi:hypothetical protein